MFAGPVLTLLPNLAVITGSVGVGLICYEFNRPGRVLPAAGGVLLLCFAIAAWMQQGVRPSAALLLFAAVVICLASAWRSLPGILLLAATLSLMLGLRFLALPGAPKQVSWLTAIVCGGALGGSTVVLTRIAFRARRAKALN